jgi:hypothetical protein
MRCAVRLINHEFVPNNASVALPCARCGKPSAVRVLVQPLFYVCSECLEGFSLDQNGHSADSGDGDK